MVLFSACSVAATTVQWKAVTSSDSSGMNVVCYVEEWVAGGTLGDQLMTL